MPVACAKSTARPRSFTPPEAQARLDRDAKGIEKRIKRLLDAIEVGGDAAALMAKARAYEQRQRAIRSESEHAALQPGAQAVDDAGPGGAPAPAETAG